jgi:hypothetical protein
MNEAFDGPTPTEEVALEFCFDILRDAQSAGESTLSQLITQLDPALQALANDASPETVEALRNLILDWGLALHYQPNERPGIFEGTPSDERPLSAEDFVAQLHRSRS